MISKEQEFPATQGAPAALLNGLAILECFSQAQPALSVTEIANKVGLHKSTISRVLHGLAKAGYLIRDEESGKYQLGLGVLSLAAPLLANLDPRIAARSFMEELNERTEETAALALWNGESALVVAQIASPHQVKHTASIGTQNRLWDSSSVRIILANLPIAQVKELMESGKIIVPEGADINELLADLEDLSTKGYSINDGGTTPEEFGVSAPIFDTQGKILGCIVVSAPRTRVEYKKSQNLLVKSVREAAKGVTTRLGKSTEN